MMNELFGGFAIGFFFLALVLGSLAFLGFAIFCLVVSLTLD